MEAEAPKAAAPASEFPPSLSPVTRRKLIDTRERAHAALRFVKGQLPPEVSALPPGTPLGALKGSLGGPLFGGPWLCDQLMRPTTRDSLELLGPSAAAAAVTATAADSAAAANAAATAAAAATFSCCYTPRAPFPAAAVEAARAVQQQQQQQQKQQQQQQQQQEEEASESPMSGFAVSAAVVTTRPLSVGGPPPADPLAVAANVARVFLGAQQTPHQPAQALDPGGSSDSAAAAAVQASGSPLQRGQQQQQHTTSSISGLWHVRGPPEFKAHPVEVPEGEVVREKGALLAAALFAALPGAARGALRAETHHVCFSFAK
ncbi:hypothetical protein Esti_000800 [Eimeria stiedai]